MFIGVAPATGAVILFDVSPTLAVAVGTAAGMAAMTRLVIAGPFFAAPLVGSDGFDAIPAAVLASAGAYISRPRRSTAAPAARRPRGGAGPRTPAQAAVGRTVGSVWSWGSAAAFEIRLWNSLSAT